MNALIKNNKKSVSSAPTLASRVKFLRSEKGMTLRQLSDASGASYSNLSKIETGKLSPTFDTMERIAKGLGVTISDLLAFGSTPSETGRMAVTRNGEGVIHKSATYTYQALCNDVTDKSIVPFVVKIHAQEIKDFGDLLSHDGEEILYVLDGRVEIHTDLHDPVVLDKGDCIFFDSSMGHACLTKGISDATVFWVHSALGAAQSSETIQQARHMRTFGIPTSLSYASPACQRDFSSYRSGTDNPKGYYDASFRAEFQPKPALRNMNL